MSEIDDIFASKGKQKQPPLLSSEKKKKKKKKKADPLPPKADVVAPTSKKRPLPETVVDTSDRLPAPSKRHKGAAAPPPADDSSKKSKKADKKKAEADADFKDSRGSDSRMLLFVHLADFFLTLSRSQNRGRLVNIQRR